MNTDQLKNSANELIKTADEIRKYKQSKQVFLDKINQLNTELSTKKITHEKFDEELEKLLKGKTRQGVTESYNTHILELLGQIENQAITIKKTVPSEKESEFAKLFAQKEEYKHMPPKLKKKYLKELNIEHELAKQFLRRQKKGKLTAVEKDYETYEPHAYGKISNQYAGKITNWILEKKELQPHIQKLFTELRSAGFKVLSKTYLSMAVFSAMLAATSSTLLACIFFTHPFIPLQIIRGLLIGVVAGVSTGAFIFFYPSSVAKEKQGKMKVEIPFALIHMSAVAGSGAKPVSIFQTLLTSGDYPALGPDIKKIVNYVNVFGYDLTTALRLTAATTPSTQFKDILNGIINTITTGGDLKEFLVSISQDSLTTYQIERRKAVESIATYSDIYTAVLIAAPLLFFVTIAIIQMLGGQIGGLSAEVIATIGVYGIIPLLNIAFLIFISAVQPK